MSKMYAIQDSPLYRLRNRRKMAELLDLPMDYFKTEHSYWYDEFSRPKPNGDGKRNFTVPEEGLKRIQKRLCRLLARIETPNWVISGKKRNSYITNAEKHTGNSYVKTMDISKFYDSANRSHIYNMFRDTFMMAEDIAWLMTDLVTYKGKLPTGSPSSQIVVFWAYRDMFEIICDIADRYGCTFTLYVDDMTFSSPVPISDKLRDAVALTLRRQGLFAKAKKDHYYQKRDIKVITGVGIKDGKQVVLNRNRKRIIDQYAKCQSNNDIKEIEKLNGMLHAARQIEPDIFPAVANYVSHYKKRLANMAKNRYSDEQQKRAMVSNA